jgi:hypothetical protein
MILHEKDKSPQSKHLLKVDEPPMLWFKSKKIFNVVIKRSSFKLLGT